MYFLSSLLKTYCIDLMQHLISYLQIQHPYQLSFPVSALLTAVSYLLMFQYLLIGLLFQTILTPPILLFTYEVCFNHEKRALS